MRIDEVHNGIDQIKWGIRKERFEHQLFDYNRKALFLLDLELALRSIMK